MRLTLRQVRAFVEVADTQSFTTAAERLDLTQSAVSMLVRQLEDTLGLQLFNRTGQGAILTEFGAQALPGFTRALTELHDVTDAAQGLTDLSRGYLRLALTQILSIAWLPETLADYRAAHPGIRIEILDTVGDRIVEAVSNNEAELGIGPKRTLPPDLEAHPIWEVPIQVALPAASPLAQKPDLGSADLAHCQWIHYSDEFDLFVERTIFNRGAVGRTHGIRMRGLVSALALLSQGDFATAAPAYARVFAPLFDVAFRSIVEAPASQTFMVYYRKGHAVSPAARAFIDLAKTRAPAGAALLTS